MKAVLGFGLAVMLVGAMAAGASAPAAAPPGGEVKKWAFENADALAGWTVKGDVAIDAAKAREGKGGALKVGPGGEAVFKLADKEGSGKVELWVYDDLTQAEKPKEYRAGPRWGLLQSDGRVLTVGIIYSPYVGGIEGYTASPSDGKKWFEETFWLSQNRAPAGWHKWTFVFDPEKGLKVLHNDKATSLDPTKVGLKGFTSIVLLGDSGAAPGQTIWVADVSASPMGEIKAIPQPKPVAKKVEGPNPWTPSDQKVAIHTKDKPPAAPKLEDLAEKDSLSQYGITWTFDKPARVGQFINGDWYVVGPVTVKAISPKPLYGTDIPEIELDHMDLERPAATRVRNGFMLNPPALQKVAYDSGVRNWWDPSLVQKLPVAMKPGDSLVSTISMPNGLVLVTQLGRNKDTRGDEDASPTRTAAVLSCVEKPLPPDAFRPAFCDRQAKIFYSRDLKRELLPTVAPTKGLPAIALYVRYTQRPWVNTGFFGFEIPVENTPWYGLEYGRVVGNAALLLCTDAKPDEKEPLLVDFVQVGIDLGGMVRAGHPGWEGFGGHGSGRKMPIVFAGFLLGDEQLSNINKSFPKAHFGEDEQTAYGDTYIGAKVVFAGHRAIDQATGIARPGTGPYEHKQPATWTGGDKTSESYRRCCTSRGWISQALALRLMKAEKAWDHEAFLDYCDRWMHEDEKEALEALKKIGIDEPDWAQEGHTEEDWVMEMWAKHRTGPGMPPTDGWKKQHDDSYLRTAMEKATTRGR